MRRPTLALASLVAVGLLGSTLPALADAPADRLVRLITPPTLVRPHPLADTTGRIPITVPLPKGVTAQDLGLLPVAPGIGAVRLDPGEIDAFSALHPGLPLHVSPPRRPLLDRSLEWTRTFEARETTGLDGTGVVVGVIDTGLDITHPDFRDENGKTRVAWMLTLGEPRGVYPDIEAKFGCSDPSQQPCAVYSAEDINDLLASGDVNELHDIEGHGTHVTSIAAGNGGVMLKEKPRFVGVAPGATLVIASQLNPGGGFSDPDILNAARFIFDRADAMAADAMAADPNGPKIVPAVINLSVGGDFGSHDGTSDLEKGLAAMVGDDKPGRAIVVAAGNSGAIYQFADTEDWAGIHTEVHVSPNAETRVPIVAGGAKAGKGFVWVTFRPGDEVSVGLEGPGGTTWIPLTEPGTDRGYEEDGATAGVINNILNGKAPLTADTNSAVVAWEGKWPDPSEFAILLSGHGDAQLWLVGLGDAVASAASVGLLFQKAIKQGTITVPASHPSLLSVGCTINRLAWDPAEGPALQITGFGGVEDPVEDSACYFSSAGPTPFGVPKPEISAPGGFVAAAMSADADPRKARGGLFDTKGCPDEDIPCFVVDDRHAVTAGSSMSAPHVAGAVALLFQKRPDLTQAQVTDAVGSPGTELEFAL